MFLSSFWQAYMMMLKANAKTKTSPFLTDLTQPRFSRNRNKNSKKRGNMQSASSTLLLAGSNKQANEQRKLAKRIFHLQVFYLLFAKKQMPYQKQLTQTERKSEDLIIFLIQPFRILIGSFISLFLLNINAGRKWIGMQNLQAMSNTSINLVTALRSHDPA